MYSSTDLYSFTLMQQKNRLAKKELPQDEKEQADNPYQKFVKLQNDLKQATIRNIYDQHS